MVWLSMRSKIWVRRLRVIDSAISDRPGGELTKPRVEVEEESSAPNSAGGVSGGLAKTEMNFVVWREYEALPKNRFNRRC